METKTLVSYLNTILRIDEIKDYGPQGHQVEAETKEVNRIALAVDVSPQIIEKSAEWQADMLLVHHGILWRSVEKIAGPLGKRVRGLLRHNMHLYAAHLPLDAHAEYGNNAVLGRLFGVTEQEFWGSAMGTPLGVIGQVDGAPSLAELVEKVNTTLNTTATVLANGPEQVNKLAILSGFGADRIAEAKALGADTYLTGETSHANYWGSADYDINVIFAGHYATETVGVQALGQHLTEKFGLETHFFDFPTGM